METVGNNDQATTPIDFDLPALIAKRKAEVQQKAKNKQLEDFKQIARSNWSNPDGLHPLQVLPKEMWLEVLNNLRDPRDLQQASQCCPLFSELLEPRRISDILLPLALDVARFRTELMSDSHNVVDFLPLRAVCKSLRDHVDKCIEKDYVYRIPYPDDDEADTYPKIRLTLRHFDPSYATRALRLPIKNCFIGLSSPDDNRDLHGLSRTEHRNCFLDLLNQALRFVGAQLTHLNFGFDFVTGFDDPDENVTGTEVYKRLLQVLSWTPNLKVLDVHLHHENIMDNSGLEHEPELQEMLRRQPFPTFEKLEYLRLNSIGKSQEMDILESALRSNPHVRKVFLWGTTFTDGLIDALKSLTLLESLSLSLIQCVGTSTDLLEKLSQPQANWQLKKVDVIFVGGKVSLERLFRYLETFQGLETVHLKFVNVGMIDLSVPPLKLPKLKVFNFSYCLDDYKTWLREQTDVDEEAALKMINNGFTLGLDYLFEADQLEEVYWRNEMAYDMTNGGNGVLEPVGEQVIEFNGGTADLCESNLWQILPSLKRLYVTDHLDGSCLNVYCRGEVIDVIRNDP